MEINRLREMYRKDLPLYDVPAPRTRSKRKLTGTFEQIECNAKKRRVDNPIRANPVDSQLEQRVWPFKFHSVNEQWQCNACASLGLQFDRSNGASPGSGNLPLTHPDKIKTIVGDGNCMFRSLSYILSRVQRGYVKKLFSTCIRECGSTLYVGMYTFLIRLSSETFLGALGVTPSRLPLSLGMG